MLLKRFSFYIRLNIGSNLKPGFEPPALCQEQIHFALIENILFINYRRKKRPFTYFYYFLCNEIGLCVTFVYHWKVFNFNRELWLNLHLFHKENKTFSVTKSQRLMAFSWLNGFNCISFHRQSWVFILKSIGCSFLVYIVILRRITNMLPQAY